MSYYSIFTYEKNNNNNKSFLHCTHTHSHTHTPVDGKRVKKIKPIYCFKYIMYIV